jgi:hypothetical protein
MYKICNKCGKKLSIKCFYKRNDTKNYRLSCKNCHHKDQREYHLANKARRNERSRKHYRDNKEHYWELNDKWEKEHPEQTRAYKRRYLLKIRGTSQARYNEYRGLAAKKKRVFEITLKYFTKLTSQRCHYCGISGKIGVDRKDNSKGYVKENCLPCCIKCNRKKARMSYEDFMEYRKNPIYNKSRLERNNYFYHRTKNKLLFN